MKRAGLAALFVIVLVGASALLWLFSSLDGLVEDAIEQIGSELIGAPVRVGRVSIDLQAGTGEIRGVRLANPRGADDGFSDRPAFQLDEISVALDLASLTRQPLVLTRVLVARPQVNAEIRGTRLNLDVLRRNVESKAAKDVETEAELTREGEPFRIKVRSFEFERGALRLDSGDPESEAQELALPSFSMRDVGGAGGSAPAALGKAILQGILAHTAAAAARQRAQQEAGAWIDDKLEDRPAAAEAAKQVLEGILGGGSDE